MSLYILFESITHVRRTRLCDSPRWIFLEAICPGDLEPGRRVGHSHTQVPFVKGHHVLAMSKAGGVVLVEFPHLVGVESLPKETEVGDFSSKCTTTIQSY